MCCTTYSESQEASSLSSLNLLKCGISCLTTVLCALETLVILELLENQNQRSTALPDISSPKTSDACSLHMAWCELHVLCGVFVRCLYFHLISLKLVRAVFLLSIPPVCVLARTALQFPLCLNCTF